MFTTKGSRADYQVGFGIFLSETFTDCFLQGFLLIKNEERGKEILWGEGKTGRNSWALGRSIFTRFWRFFVTNKGEIGTVKNIFKFLKKKSLKIVKWSNEGQDGL